MTENEVYIELNKIFEGKVKLNEYMSKHTSFKIGGTADFFVEATSIREICLLQEFTSKNNIPMFIIGNGSNILVADKGIRGIVVKINLNNVKIEKKEQNEIVTFGAGCKISAIAHMLAKKGISGFEELSSIPGTVGGAIVMNAGAYGKEVKDILISTKCLDKDGKIVEFLNEEQQFGYRTSIFKKHEYIILEARFRLEQKDEEYIIDKMREYKLKRMESQPLEYPSAGSTFKRGEGFITAKVIDECGLKGASIGDAEISQKHAGFIINKGKATYNDVLKLIEYTKEQVKKKTGLEIEEKIEYIEN